MCVRYFRLASMFRWLMGGRRIVLALVCVLVMVPIVATGCPDNTSLPAPFFPVQESSDLDQMPALAEGKLVLDNGYLRLKGFFGEGELLIWPYGFSLRIEGKEIQVIDSDGQVAACVGGRIKVGGGEVPAETAEKYIGQLLPDDCKGPYWIVSGVIDN